MTGRSFASIVLAATGCGVPSLCLAQPYSAAGQVVTLPPEAGGYGGAYSSPSFGDSGGYAGYGEATPAGAYGGASCPPGPGGPGADCPPQAAHRWPLKCRPLFITPRMLKPPRGAYLRTEYLLWEIEEPGNELLGAEDTGGINVLTGFDFDDDLFDNETDVGEGFFRPDPSNIFGFEPAYVPGLEEIQLRDNSGIRFTLGIPTYDYGTIETGIWWLNQASDHYEFGPRGNNFFFFQPSRPATTVTLDGSEANGLSLAYDRLDVVYKSDLRGADAKFVVDALSPPGEGLKLRPMFGFKYVGLQEFMVQSGQGGFGPGADPTVVTADTSNTLLGGLIGMRAELEHRWFTAGLAPAVTFAGNISEVDVASDRFASPFEGRVESSADYFDFSPILEFQGYVRVCLSDNLRFTVGYDAFWLAHVYRPARVIDYDLATDGAGLRSNVRPKREDDHVAVEGLSLGLEYVF